VGELDAEPQSHQKPDRSHISNKSGNNGNSKRTRKLSPSGQKAASRNPQERGEATLPNECLRPAMPWNCAGRPHRRTEKRISSEADLWGLPEKTATLRLYSTTNRTQSDSKSLKLSAENAETKKGAPTRGQEVPRKILHKVGNLTAKKPEERESVWVWKVRRLPI